MMPMLPIRRMSADTTGDQITDRATRERDYVIEDVSVAGFTQKYTTGFLPDSKIWGQASGLSAEISVKKWPQTVSRQFYIANTSLYNKFYYSLAGIGSETLNTHTTTIGEEWETEAVIAINSDR
ncbi:hypothetical protein D3C76_1533760 [compost metagenome]